MARRNKRRLSRKVYTRTLRRVTPHFRYTRHKRLHYKSPFKSPSIQDFRSALTKVKKHSYPVRKLKKVNTTKKSVPFHRTDPFRSISLVPYKKEKICRSRKQRREVLHATRKTGSGVKRRTPRYNEHSKVRC